MMLRRASMAVVVTLLAGCGEVVVSPTLGDEWADAGPAAQTKLLLASSGDTLYAVHHPSDATGDHLAKVRVIATFKGCEGVTDLAMSRAGELYATTATGLYTIDRSDGTCTLVATGAYPESLAFVPPGAVDPDEEALVGYAGASYVRIDPSTGSITTLGQLGSGLEVGSDLAADPLGNLFLTVTGEDCDGDVCLARVDPKTGALAEMLYAISEDISGLAFADGKLYGVSGHGPLWGLTTTPPEPLMPIVSGFPTSTPAGMLDLQGATAEP
ncbi:Hypothetical protein A7982_06195 [Minicystis rosea]|nr:Hypothetical protein A7982_06195 [Minicystis rosea]